MRKRILLVAACAVFAGTPAQTEAFLSNKTGTWVGAGLTAASLLAAIGSGVKWKQCANDMNNAQLSAAEREEAQANLGTYQAICAGSSVAAFASGAYTVGCWRGWSKEEEEEKKTAKAIKKLIPKDQRKNKALKEWWKTTRKEMKDHSLKNRLKGKSPAEKKAIKEEFNEDMKKLRLQAISLEAILKVANEDYELSNYEKLALQYSEDNPSPDAKRARRKAAGLEAELNDYECRGSTFPEQRNVHRAYPAYHKISEREAARITQPEEDEE